MTDTESKRAMGQTASRTVLQLEQVGYKITLSYLGHDRVEHDDDDYRCIYELQRGESAITTIPTIIPNQVRSTDTHEDDDKAAKPYEDDGDNTNPRSDQIYRLMVTDNHGTRSADTDDRGGLLGRDGSPSGDEESKPENYAVERGGKPDWMPDVHPVVPLRITVRKTVGRVPVNLDTIVKVLCRIKDPREEFDQNQGNPRDFLEAFFAEYNREQDDPDEGDDNCPLTFSGIRDPDSDHSGVKASDVLGVIPYEDPPPADTPDGETPATVDFDDIEEATEGGEGNMGAVFELTEAEEDGVTVGVADVAFAPYPAFGDNYRFLLTVLDESDADIRDTEEHGAEVELLDDADDRIAKPRAYATGRIVLWKRMNIKLVVLGNRTQQTDINWTDVENTYKREFIEVVRPDATTGYFNLRAEQWITELKNEFPATADQNALDAIAAAPAPNDLNTVYGRYFFPTHLTDNYDRNRLSAAIVNITRTVIEHACDNTTPRLLYPGSTDAKKQGPEVRERDSAGFFIFLVRRLGSPTAPAASVRIGNLLGSSFGDRMFWFANTALHPNAAVDLTTQTLSHEMGHAQYLRHSHTQGPIAGFGGGGDQARWFAAPPASGPAPSAVNIRFFDSRHNNQILDHDQADAFNCLMSYTAPDALKPPFCGMCTLTLRFYDRVEIQSEDEYQEQIMQGHDPASIARAGISSSDVWTLREPPVVDGTPKLPDLRVGRSMIIVCVGVEFDYNVSSTATRKARVNLTCCDDDPLSLWSQSGSGAVRLRLGRNTRRPIYLRVTGRTAGTVTLSFAKSGLEATAEIEVTE